MKKSKSGVLPPLGELQGEGTSWLKSTRRGVGVEAWGTHSDGSDCSPWESRQNSPKTKIKWRERIIASPMETWWLHTALRHLYAVVKDWT